MTSQLKHWKHYEAQLITYDVIMKNNGKVRDVRSLACKIKVLNGCDPGSPRFSALIPLLISVVCGLGSERLSS